VEAGRGSAGARVLVKKNAVHTKCSWQGIAEEDFGTETFWSISNAKVGNKKEKLEKGTSFRGRRGGWEVNRGEGGTQERRRRIRPKVVTVC